MAVTIYIGDSQGSVDLSTAYLAEGYSPRVAPDYEEWVMDTGNFKFSGGIAAVRTSIQNLGRYFVQAREWNSKRVGEPVYIKMKWQASDDLYRSEIMGGVCMPGDMALDYGPLQSGTLAFQLEFTRKNYWEDNTERTLPAHGFNILNGTARLYNSYFLGTITNGSIGTTNASGTAYVGTIANKPIEAYLSKPVLDYRYNGSAFSGTFVAGTDAAANGSVSGTGISSGTLNYHTGAWGINFSAAPGIGTLQLDYVYGYGNYFDIVGTAISGDIPAPLKISMAMGTLVTHLWIGATYGEGTAYQPNAYEAEIYHGTAGSGSASGYASNGTTWNFVQNVDGLAIQEIQINGQQRIALQNEYLIPILVYTHPDNTYETGWENVAFYYSITDYGRTYYYDYTTMDPAANLKCLKMPPIAPNMGQYHVDDAGGSAIIQYELWADRLSGGTVNHVLDFTQFFPTRAGYAEYSNPATLGFNKLTLDFVNMRALGDFGTNAWVYSANLAYSPITVYPNENFRAYALYQNGWLNTYNLTNDIIVKYRPRKRSV